MGSEEVRCTVSERGARKLIFQGYMYTKHRDVKAGSSWRCDFRAVKCPGRLIVDEEDIVVRSTNHTHDSDWGRCKAKETAAAIKRSAETSRASTSSIVSSKISRLSDETKMRLPKMDTLRKTVKRVKRQHLPPEPKSLSDLHDLPSRFRRILEGIYFIIQSAIE